MQVVHQHCCGLDVHKKTIVACILITSPDGTVQKQVRTFSTRGHHIKRGKTYAKAVKLVYDGGFCCKKREKRLDFHSDQSVRALSSLQVKPPEKRIHSLAYVLPRLIW